MIHCIIVDDEQHAIDILVHYVQQIPQLHLIAAFTNPMEALQCITSEKVNLVFLDIQMPELSGIDFIKALNGKCKVILTTAYSEFAMDGYELCVVDYLLKPIRLPRFLTAVQKAVEQVNAGNETPKENPDDDYIFVKTESKGKLLKIELADIDLIEGMKNYVAIHRGGKRTMVYSSMKKLELYLPPQRFIRIHKSFIIPVGRITGIEGNVVQLKNVATPVLIGENYKEELMALIKGKMIT
jgi:two-component system, LytTR family, response regulator